MVPWLLSCKFHHLPFHIHQNKRSLFSRQEPWISAEASKKLTSSPDHIIIFEKTVLYHQTMYTEHRVQYHNIHPWYYPWIIRSYSLLPINAPTFPASEHTIRKKIILGCKCILIKIYILWFSLIMCHHIILLVIIHISILQWFPCMIATCSTT